MCPMYFHTVFNISLPKLMILTIKSSLFVSTNIGTVLTFSTSIAMTRGKYERIWWYINNQKTTVVIHDDTLSPILARWIHLTIGQYCRDFDWLFLAWEICWKNSTVAGDLWRPNAHMTPLSWFCVINIVGLVSHCDVIEMATLILLPWWRICV